MAFYSKCSFPPNAEHLCSAAVEAAVLEYVLILNAGSCFQGLMLLIFSSLTDGIAGLKIPVLF